jgi:hypothetical protein
MSIRTMTWAFSQPLSGNEKVVLLALADFSNDDGECWPSIPKIAEKSYLSVRTVQRIIIELSDQRYISFVKRSADNGRPISSVYQLHIDGDKLSPYGDTGDTTMVTLLSPHKEPSIEPSLKKDNRGSRISDLFTPNDTCHATAQKLGVPITIDVIDGFIDYWRGIPGKKGLNLDWQATFRNQLRHIAKTKGIPHARTSKPSFTARNLERIAQAERDGLCESDSSSERYPLD